MLPRKPHTLRGTDQEGVIEGFSALEGEELAAKSITTEDLLQRHFYRADGKELWWKDVAAMKADSSIGQMADLGHAITALTADGSTRAFRDVAGDTPSGDDTPNGDGVREAAVGVVETPEG